MEVGIYSRGCDGETWRRLEWMQKHLAGKTPPPSIPSPSPFSMQYLRVALPSFAKTYTLLVTTKQISVCRLANSQRQNGHGYRGRRKSAVICRVRRLRSGQRNTVKNPSLPIRSLKLFRSDTRTQYATAFIGKIKTFFLLCHNCCIPQTCPWGAQMSHRKNFSSPVQPLACSHGGWPTLQQRTLSV